MRRIPYQFLPVPVPSWRPDGEPLNPIEAAVIAVFVDHWVQGEDILVVGAAELQKRTGFAQRTNDAARARLIDRGLLICMATGGGRGRPSTYRLAPIVFSGKGAARAPFADAKGGSGNGASPAPNRTGKGAAKGGSPPGLKGAAPARLSEETTARKKAHAPEGFAEPLGAGSDRETGSTPPDGAGAPLPRPKPPVAMRPDEPAHVRAARASGDVW